MGSPATSLPLRSFLNEFIGTADIGAGMEGPVRAPAAAIHTQLAVSSGKAFSSWTALSAVVGTAAGERAEVYGDLGTHIDPVTSELVANSGVYGWSVSPAGW